MNAQLDMTADLFRTPRTKQQIEQEWIFTNADAYDALVFMTTRDVRRGVKPSIGYYFEVLRRPWTWDYEVAQVMERWPQRPAGHVYTCNNSIRALLVRRIEREYFGGADVFDKRRSEADPPMCPAATPRPAVETLGRAVAGEGPGNGPATAHRSAS